MLAVAGLVAVTGCSTTVRYSPDVVAQHIQRVGAPLPGKVLVHTTPAQDAYVYGGRPSTFAGSAVKANIPFGQMSREIALKTFEGAFRQGAVAGHSMRNAADYQVIIMPQITHFNYFYRVSPGSLIQSVADVQMKMRAKVLSPQAVVLVDREYDSHRVLSDPTAGYMPKVLGKVAHTVLCDLMADVARDVKLAVLQQAMTAPAARPVAPPVDTPRTAPGEPRDYPPPAALPDPVQVIPDPVMVD